MGGLEALPSDAKTDPKVEHGGPALRCLDTPLLEDLLRARKRARAWVASLEGSGEVATTEVSMVELGILASRGPGGRGALVRRKEALERLRRALTVLPLDARSAEKVMLLTPPPARRAQDGASTLPIVGICLAHGVEELLTLRGRWVPHAPSALKVIRV